MGPLEVAQSIPQRAPAGRGAQCYPLLLVTGRLAQGTMSCHVQAALGQKAAGAAVGLLGAGGPEPEHPGPCGWRVTHDGWSNVLAEFCQ